MSKASVINFGSFQHPYARTGRIDCSWAYRSTGTYFRKGAGTSGRRFERAVIGSRLAERLLLAMTLSGYSRPGAVGRERRL